MNQFFSPINIHITHLVSLKEEVRVEYYLSSLILL